MAKLPDIGHLSLHDLRALALDVGNMIVHKQSEERDRLKAELRKLAGDAGFTIDEIFFTKNKRAKPGAPAVKYRNPDNPSETWSGRGRRPAWFAAAMKRKGAAPEQLAA